MGKFKIWGAYDKEPIKVINYDSNDVDATELAYEEKSAVIEKIFKDPTIKELYVMHYGYDEEHHTTTVVTNKNFVDTFVFIVCLNAPIVYGVYKTIETAKEIMQGYLERVHPEFEKDEIKEIVEELIQSGEYEMKRTKYYFSAQKAK